MYEVEFVASRTEHQCQPVTSLPSSPCLGGVPSPETRLLGARSLTKWAGFGKAA